MTAQTDETKIAVLSANFKSLSDKFDRALTILESLPNVYLTQKEHVDFVNAVDKRFLGIESEMANAKRDQAISTWIERVSIGVAVAIITFLAMFYMQHGGGK